jgi:hypothetical protein
VELRGQPAGVYHHLAEMGPDGSQHLGNRTGAGETSFTLPMKLRTSGVSQMNSSATFILQVGKYWPNLLLTFS